MIRLLLQILGLLFSLAWTVATRGRPPLPMPELPDPNAPSAESLRDGHEVSDARPKIAAILVGILFLVIFGSMGALAAMYMHFYTRAPAIPVPKRQESFPEAPLHRTSIEDDWTAINAEAQERLETYGWMDAAHTVVRIPIARAMELLAAEGMPARTGTAPLFPDPGEEKRPVSETQPAIGTH